MSRPRPRMHLDAGADHRRHLAVAKFVGEREVADRLLVQAEAGGRATHHEVRLTRDVGMQVAQLQAALGDLVGLRDMPLHEACTEQSHQADQLQSGVTPLLGEVTGALEDRLHLG